MLESPRACGARGGQGPATIDGVAAAAAHYHDTVARQGPSAVRGGALRAALTRSPRREPRQRCDERQACVDATNAAHHGVAPMTGRPWAFAPSARAPSCVAM